MRLPHCFLPYTLLALLFFSIGLPNVSADEFDDPFGDLPPSVESEQVFDPFGDPPMGVEFEEVFNPFDDGLRPIRQKHLKPSPLGRLTAEQDRQEADLRGRLASVKITIAADKMPLKEFVGSIAKEMGCGYRLHSRTLDLLGTPLTAEISFTAQDLLADTTLTLALGEQGLVYWVEGERIIVRDPQDRSRSGIPTDNPRTSDRPIAEFHSLADLLVGEDIQFASSQWQEALTATAYFQSLGWTEDQVAAYQGGIAVTQSPARHAMLKSLLDAVRSIPPLGEEGSIPTSIRATPQAELESALWRRLRETKVSVEWEATSLTKAIAELREQSETPIYLDVASLKAAEVPLDKPINGRWHEAPLDLVLRDIAFLMELEWVVWQDVVRIVSPVDAERMPVMKLYPVEDLADVVPWGNIPGQLRMAIDRDMRTEATLVPGKRYRGVTRLLLDSNLLGHDPGSNAPSLIGELPTGNCLVIDAPEAAHEQVEILLTQLRMFRKNSKSYSNRVTLPEDPEEGIQGRHSADSADRVPRKVTITPSATLRSAADRNQSEAELFEMLRTSQLQLTVKAAPLEKALREIEEGLGHSIDYIPRISREKPLTVHAELNGVSADTALIYLLRQHRLSYHLTADRVTITDENYYPGQNRTFLYGIDSYLEGSLLEEMGAEATPELRKYLWETFFRSRVFGSCFRSVTYVDESGVRGVMIAASRDVHYRYGELARHLIKSWRVGDHQQIEASFPIDPYGQQNEALWEKLVTTRMEELNWEKTPLDQVLRELSHQMEIPIIPSTDFHDLAKWADRYKVTDQWSDVSLATLLDDLISSQGFRWMIWNECVVVYRSPGSHDWYDLSSARVYLLRDLRGTKVNQWWWRIGGMGGATRLLRTRNGPLFQPQLGTALALAQSDEAWRPHYGEKSQVAQFPAGYFVAIRQTLPGHQQTERLLAAIRARQKEELGPIRPLPLVLYDPRPKIVGQWVLKEVSENGADQNWQPSRVVVTHEGGFLSVAYGGGQLIRDIRIEKADTPQGPMLVDVKVPAKEENQGPVWLPGIMKWEGNRLLLARSIRSGWDAPPQRPESFEPAEGVLIEIWEREE